MKKASAVIAVTALAATGLVACGGGSDNNDTTAAQAPATTQSTGTTGGAAGGASTVDISTPSGSDLAFDQKDATAKAGSVTVDLDNKQSLSHDVAIADSSGKVLGQTELVASGTTSTTVDLQPGSYTFYCTVPGHREAGMEGTLTVK
jgi:plastocyanin